MDFHVPSRQIALKNTSKFRREGTLGALSLLLNSVFFIIPLPLCSSRPHASDCQVSSLPPKAAWQNVLLISALITTIILIINKPLTPRRNKRKWQVGSVSFKTHVNRNPGGPHTATAGCHYRQRMFPLSVGSHSSDHPPLYLHFNCP